MIVVEGLLSRPPNFQQINQIKKNKNIYRSIEKSIPYHLFFEKLFYMQRGLF